MTERDAQASALARDILILARNTLMVRFRFLDRGLARLALKETENVLFATDGRHIYYDAWVVLNRYRSESTVIARDMLHSLLHLIFRHPFIGGDIDRPLWDLACDMAVEHIIADLKEPCLYASREAKQGSLIAAIEAEAGARTAERIYHVLREKQVSAEEAEEAREPYYADMHGVWYGAADGTAHIDEDIDLRVVWEQLSKRMQSELEHFSEDGGLLMQELAAINRRRCSYTDFLRRFGVMSEVLHLSEEEFDNNYYAYGMELYGNIPLIEPLEYRDRRRIRDFVIAIDTSGSVSGDVVQSFIQHTCDILTERETFEERINLRIIQCDDRIREIVKLTSRGEFDAYIRDMRILGLGETDFRPVFAKVEQLLDAGEFTDLRGLLYFTDGKGIFPEKRPSFDTAFVIHTDGFDEPEVPGWAVKLVMSKEDIRDGRFDN